MHKVSVFFSFTLLFLFAQPVGAQSLEQKDLENFLTRVHGIENRLTQIEKDNKTISQQQEKILTGLDEIRNLSRRVGDKKT